MGAREDCVDVCGRPRLGDERHALVTVKAGERCERPAFDLDNRDAQRRGMNRERVKRRAPLRYDQEPESVAARGERLLNRSAAGDELLPFPDQRVSLWICLAL